MGRLYALCYRTGSFSTPFFVLSVIISLAIPSMAYGQSAVLTNDGAHLTSTSGATVYIQGELRNQVSGGNTGTITNDGTLRTEHGTSSNAPLINQDPNATLQGDGTYRIQGDWVNNGVFNAGNSEVILDGADQSITGNSLSAFHDLTLRGTGTKTQTLDAELDGVLDLGARHFHTDSHTLSVLNPSPGAIIRSGTDISTVEGFVSSDTTGWLLRELDQSSEYLFPVGDSVPNSRYRPAELMPSSGGPQTIRVRFENRDPSNDGYDVLSKESGIGPVNEKFYWRIDRTSGSGTIDLEFFYDKAVDSADLGVHWNGQWEQMGAPTKTSNASPQLSSISHSGWNAFSPNSFALAKNPLTVDAGADTSVCKGTSIQLNATVQGGSGPYGFEWTPATYLDDPNAQDPIAQNVTGPITYYVTVHDSSSNTSSEPDTIQLDVITAEIIANDDVDTVESGAAHTIEVGANDSGFAGDSAIYTPPQEGEAYWVFGGIRYEAPQEPGLQGMRYFICDARCPNVCDSAEVSIQVQGEEELFIPSGVSADGDGFNDVWEIDGLEAYPQNSVTIFNRWGDPVFSAAPYENNWDGQGKNGTVVEGTYFYVLELGGGEEERTGYIEFRR